MNWADFVLVDSVVTEGRDLIGLRPFCLGFSVLLAGIFRARLPYGFDLHVLGSKNCSTYILSIAREFLRQR